MAQCQGYNGLWHNLALTQQQTNKHPTKQDCALTSFGGGSSGLPCGDARWPCVESPSLSSSSSPRLLSSSTSTSSSCRMFSDWGHCESSDVGFSAMLGTDVPKVSEWQACKRASVYGSYNYLAKRRYYCISNISQLALDNV